MNITASRMYTAALWLVFIQAAGCASELIPCEYDAACGEGEICHFTEDAGFCGAPSGDSRSPIDEIRIDSGAFEMGCTLASDDTCEDTETPIHEVSLGAFYIDRTEVTASAYAAFLNIHGQDCDGHSCIRDFQDTLPVEESATAWRAKTDYQNRPMTEVTWYGADTYCRWRGQRLCAEAEWERAARGDDGRLYPWGNEPATCDLAHMNATDYGCDSLVTADVGSYPTGASPFGVLDMAGNVWEWVADWWHSDYVDAPTNGEPWLVPEGQWRVVRGGGATSGAEYLRSAHRWNAGPNDGNAFYGFRCCRTGH